jgi:nicotinate-nucleotide adenylyltransferase
MGHMIIANYIIEYGDVEQLWFVVSPHNPLKEKKSLLQDHHRLEMVRLAIENDDRFQASDIEFKLPTPSYTIDTLAYLEEKYPAREFQLVMGSDGLRTFHRWKHSNLITRRYHRIIYPRPGYHGDASLQGENATMVKAPGMEISSSFIRQAIREGKDMRYMMPEKAYRYMKEMHFYE